MERHIALLLASKIEPDQLMELAIQYDRLNGTNISGNASLSNIEKIIDESSGKIDSDRKKFFEFIIKMVERMPGFD